MHGIKPRVGQCFDRYKEPGKYDVWVTAGGDGALQKLSVVGPDERIARCIEDVARSDLRMPPSEDGAPYSLAYPFILR